MADGAAAATPYGRAERSAGANANPRRLMGRYREPLPSEPRDEHEDEPGDGAGAHRTGPASVDRTFQERTDAVGGYGRVTSIDRRRFRTILGRFATGVVGITAIDPETGGANGLAANSFTSVSLDPPLVSFCVAHTSTTWRTLRGARRFCVNVLSARQRDVCLRLAARGGDKLAGLEWTVSPGGGPVIEGALAWLECSVEAEHVAGDHMIVVARVHHLDRHHDGDPLVFYQGAYGSFRD